MNTNVQQAGLKLSPRAGNAQANSVRDRLVAWFSRCDIDRLYF